MQDNERFTIIDCVAIPMDYKYLWEETIEDFNESLHNYTENSIEYITIKRVLEQMLNNEKQHLERSITTKMVIANKGE